MLAVFLPFAWAGSIFRRKLHRPRCNVGLKRENVMPARTGIVPNPFPLPPFGPPNGLTRDTFITRRGVMPCTKAQSRQTLLPARRIERFIRRLRCKKRPLFSPSRLQRRCAPTPPSFPSPSPLTANSTPRDPENRGPFERARFSCPSFSARVVLRDIQPAKISIARSRHIRRLVEPRWGNHQEDGASEARFIGTL